MRKQSIYSENNLWYDHNVMAEMGGEIPGHKFKRAIKRAIDLFVCVSALFLLFPVIIICGIAIKLDSKGPALYRHKRIGQGNRPFELLKFRSMISNGDDSSYMDYLKELIESESNGDKKGLPYRKMSEDERVTRVGRCLRNYYLDEIPQVFNVIKGDMSLVGPRPHVQFEVDNYTEDQHRRLLVKPGITGLWQVEGKADCTFSELLQLDLDYIDNWNLMLDIRILINTILLIIRGGENFWTRKQKVIPN